MGKFKAALDSEQVQGPRSRPTWTTPRKFGARGTPTFFINGRNLRGAQPFEAFKAVIDEEIKKADAKLKAGVAARAALRRADQGRPGQGGRRRRRRPAARRASPTPARAYKADVEGAPVKGAKDALVTIVQFSDFQCPFCSRVEPTIDKVMEEYKGKVRVVWQRPARCPSTTTPCPPPLAARAAGEQGKFWEMHDKLFANQQALDRASLEKYAQELGLNMAKFKAALDANKYKDDDPGRRGGGQQDRRGGTPAFFINGTVPVGRAAVRGVQGQASTRS